MDINYTGTNMQPRIASTRELLTYKYFFLPTRESSKIDSICCTEFLCRSRRCFLNKSLEMPTFSFKMVPVSKFFL